MIERHDPLTNLVEPQEAPAVASPKIAKRSRKPKLSSLLHEVSELNDDTLAFLYGGPEQQPSDYQRNLKCAGEIREEFVQFCTASNYFSNWRQAWAAFMAQQPTKVSSETQSIAAVNAPALPRWKARFIQAARS
jgi:hypothetical protein